MPATKRFTLLADSREQDRQRTAPNRSRETSQQGELA